VSALLVPTLTLVALVLVCVGFALVARRAPSGPSARRTARWRWSGVALGVAVAVWLVLQDALGRGLLLAAPAVGIGVLLGVLGGELAATGPSGSVRQASLRPRRVVDYLPRALTPAVVAASGALVVVLGVTTAMASPDDLGRPGRWLAAPTGPSTSEARGPWPGSYYSVPVVLVVAVGALLAVLALVAVVRRPRPGDPLGDDGDRARSAAAVVGGAGVLVSLPLTGVSALAAIGLLGFSVAPLGWRIGGWALVALVPAALVLLVWSSATLLVPTGAARRQDTPAAATGAVDDPRA
jgi:hypothetical protein